LNSQCVGISFPRTNKPQKFDIYRFTELTKSPSGSYQNIPKDGSNGIPVYHTKDWMLDEASNSQKIGEINIIRLNMLTREVEGTFYFRAFGYKFGESSVNPINDSVNITKGEFFYRWRVNWEY
jgi:hypothetical protein